MRKAKRATHARRTTQAVPARGLCAAVNECRDRLWYHRHASVHHTANSPEQAVIMAEATANAARLEQAYPGIQACATEYELGVLEGRLSALLWVLGEDEFLDT